jgi:hypothetical protein
MRDLDLWRRLESGEDDPEIAVLLRELAALPMIQRAAFFGFVDRLLRAPRPDVRAAAVALLAGARGVTGIARIVDALDDDDPSVREAAVASLRASAQATPARWAHAVFHPRVDVRRLALGGEPPPLAKHYGAYLRSDPELADLARAQPWPNNALPLAIHLLARGELSVPEAEVVLLDTSAEDLRALMRHSVRRPHDRVKWMLSEAQRRPTLPALDGFDLFDVWCRVCWAASQHRGKLLQRMADAVLGDAHPQLRLRLAVSMLLHGARHGFDEDLLRLVAACHPRTLLFPALPLRLRKAAVFGLHHHRERLGPPIGDVVFSLFDAGFATREDGSLDLTIAAILSGFYTVKRVPTLVDRFGEAVVLDAVAHQPEAWPIVCELPEEPDGGPEWFVTHLRHSATLAPFLAIGLPIWQTRHAEQNKEGVATVFTRVLAGLDSATLVDVLVALGRAALDGLPEARPKAVDRLVDHLEPLIKGRDLTDLFARLLPLAKPETIALSVLERCARRRDGKSFTDAMLDLDAASLRLLVAITDIGLALQRSKEHALALALQHHTDEDVARWAERILADFTKLPPTAAAPKVVGVRHLSPTQLAAIVDATTHDLEKALEPALAAPSIGLAEALSLRPNPTSPHRAACLALAACADSVIAVGEQLERFGSHEATFRDELQLSIIEHWQGRQGLPPLCHAFLHRWEQHGFALLQWMDRLKGGLAEALRGTLDVDGSHARQVLFDGIASAILLRRYRQPNRMAAFATAEVMSMLVEQLDTDLGPMAARILVAFHLHGSGKEHLERLRDQVVLMLADMSRDTLFELDRWVRIDGLRARAEPARPHVARLRADRLLEIRGCRDLDRLVKDCRSANPKVVQEATLRLIELGARGHARLVELLAERPTPGAAATIVESIPLWSDDDSLAGVRRIATDLAAPAELRFRIAMALCERGESGWIEPALVAVREPSESLWLTARDFELLRQRTGDDRLACVTLAGSPHPHAYQRAVTWLVEHGGDGDDVRAALHEFLESGTDRPVYLRRSAARRLLELRDMFGLAVCVAHVLDHESRPYRWLYDKLDPTTLDRVIDHALDATLLGGREACIEERCHTLSVSKALPVPTRERAFRRLLLEGQDAAVRQKIVSALGMTIGREVKLGHVAEIFAWGIRKGRELTGRLFRVHMTERRQDFGYTRFNESSIYVSPLPVLRGDRHGRDIVEALILHEYGHHVYHRAEQSQKVWKRAHKEGIGSILNLVADEHLERNLRAVEPEYGDKLKRLAAYAFQHAEREVKIESLFSMLLASTGAALCERPLGVAFDEESVEVVGGQILRELDRTGHPFARFVRALRMGLGNRSDDPLLDRALDLFKGNFRHKDMQGLYEIALQLSEMYGSGSCLADAFGGHESLEWGDREGSIHGEGLVDDDVQQEVERILNPQRRKSSDRPGRPGGKLQINVSGDGEFKEIDKVDPVRADRDQHRIIASEVRRHSERLRQYLTELGLSLVPRRARLRGRAFDRTRARAVVLRRDPRMLVSREIESFNDLFIGVVVDCSGSMASGGSMDKAHRFGVLIAEAVRPLHGVDARFFGFTDRVIFDAGNKHDCAVTSLRPTGGNNDAAGLYHAAKVAAVSARRSKLLVMVSDGLPTECTVTALRNLVNELSRRRGILCAQVAVRPLAEVCFPHYVELTDPELDRSVRRFGEIVSNLARRALGR